MNSVKISLLVVFFTIGLNAQQVEFLTKEAAVAEVLESNFGITIAKNNVEIAENNKSVLNSGYLPAVTANAGANYSINDEEDMLQDGTFRDTQDVETVRYNASLNLNYTLFDGLGRMYDYKSLKEQYDLSELQARETIENTLLQMFTVYFEVARITENVTVLEETFQLTKERLTRAEFGFEYGQNNKLDVLNAEVDIVTDSINLMNTRQQLRNTKRDLSVILNSDLERKIAVDTVIQFTEKLVLEAFEQEADTNNVRLLQAARNISISDYDYKASKSIYLPTVGLTGSYGWNETDFPSTSFLLSKNTTIGLSAGLSLSWSLFDGGRGVTGVKNAKIRYENQEVFQRQVVVEVRRDIANAKGNYESRLEIFKLLSQNVVTAKNNFERSNERYKLGQITSVELRLAQVNLLNARTNKNLAKYQAKLAELQYLQLTGQLLNTRF